MSSSNDCSLWTWIMGTCSTIHHRKISSAKLLDAFGNTVFTIMTYFKDFLRCKTCLYMYTNNKVIVIKKIKKSINILTTPLKTPVLAAPPPPPTRRCLGEIIIAWYRGKLTRHNNSGKSPLMVISSLLLSVYYQSYNCQQNSSNSSFLESWKM